MFLDWYVPHVTERPATPAARDAFTALWAEIIACLDGKERGWVLLDYHSPNLFWLPDRTGLARLAIIDFQDLMVGPSAYDVASLCQDARVTIPAGLEAAKVSAERGHEVVLFEAADQAGGQVRLAARDLLALHIGART